VRCSLPPPSNPPEGLPGCLPFAWLWALADVSSQFLPSTIAAVLIKTKRPLPSSSLAGQTPTAPLSFLIFYAAIEAIGASSPRAIEEAGSCPFFSCVAGELRFSSRSRCAKEEGAPFLFCCPEGRNPSPRSFFSSGRLLFFLGVFVPLGKGPRGTEGRPEGVSTHLR